MANPPELKDWLLANADRLDLQAAKFTWTDGWLPGYVDFAVSITVNGQVFPGRGLASSEDGAFTKAGAEALERCIFRSSGLPNTNGLAVHVVPALAAENAKLELIERDAFFCHYLTKTPFLQIDPHSMRQLPFDMAVIARKLAAQGATLELRQMLTVNNLCGVAASVTGLGAKKPFGIVLGLGCDEHLGAAIEHAVLECLSRALVVIDGKDMPTILSVSEFKALTKPKTSDHDALGLNREASSPTRRLFTSVENTTHGGPSLIHSIVIDGIELPPEISDAPLSACLATCESLQSAFFGHISPGLINLGRISSFRGTPIAYEALEKVPHVFG